MDTDLIDSPPKLIENSAILPETPQDWPPIRV